MQPMKRQSKTYTVVDGVVAVVSVIVVVTGAFVDVEVVPTVIVVIAGIALMQEQTEEIARETPRSPMTAAQTALPVFVGALVMLDDLVAVDHFADVETFVDDNGDQLPLFMLLERPESPRLSSPRPLSLFLSTGGTNTCTPPVVKHASVVVVTVVGITTVTAYICLASQVMPTLEY